MAESMSNRKGVCIAPSHYHVGHIVPAMVAKELSYFEEEGLINYVIYPGGLIPAMVEHLALHRAMKEKSVDIVPDIKPSALFRLVNRQGAELYIVGCWRSRRETRWYGAKGMKSMADLKGRRIGIRDPGDINHTALRFALKRAGLDPDRDVTFVAGARFHGQDDPTPYLRNGEVDCISSSRGGKELEADGYPLLLDSREIFPQGRTDRVIIATRRMVEENVDLLTAYLRATIRAYWILADFDRTGWYTKALVQRLRRACLDEEESRRPSLEAGGGGGGSLVVPFDGAPAVSALEAMVEESKELEDIDPDFQLSSVLRLDPVRDAFKELSARPELQEQMASVREVYRARGRPVAV